MEGSRLGMKELGFKEFKITVYMSQLIAGLLSQATHLQVKTTGAALRVLKLQGLGVQV